MYKSSWDGVLFPFGRPYAFLIEKIHYPSPVEWEGIAYVGIASVFILFSIAFSLLKNLISLRFKELFIIDINLLLSVFFWASIAALIYSFGFPFIFWDLLLDYVGPLKQMRGIGRFSWIFYYVINIIAFYKLYHWSKNKKSIIKYFILIIACCSLLFDAYYNIKNHEKELNNKVEQLIDKENNLPDDEWMKNFDPHKYQAIIPIPYVHVGSENVGFSPSEIMKYVYIVSLKTGLPTTAVSMSRTSLSQSYKNIQLVLEPYSALEIIKDFPNQKPFLVLARENEMRENEKYLFNKCKLLTKTPSYNVYQLDFHSLEHLSDSLYWRGKEDFHKQKLFAIDNYYSSDSLKTFIHDGFDEISSAIIFRGKGAYEGILPHYNVLFDGTIPHLKTEEYVFSFWMRDFKNDMYPRSSLEVDLSDNTGAIYQVDYPGLSSMLKVLNGDWALLEQKFKLKNSSDRIKITLWNNEIRQDKKLILDELWIKPLSTNIYQENKEELFKNNRYYHL